jgi:hypothetical protein
MKHVVDVARMQSANRLWSVGYPMLALVLGFVNVLAVMVGGASPSVGNGGLGASVFVVIAGSHFVGVTQFYPFCAGLSVTRRDFLAGTALVAVVQAFGVGIGIVALAALEGATGGWGAGVWSFRSAAVVNENIAVQWIAVVAPVLAYAACGILVGVVHLRWGRLGLVVMGAGLGVLVLAAAAALIPLGAAAGRDVGQVAGPPVLVVSGLLPVVAALVVSGAGYLVLRRATP